MGSDRDRDQAKPKASRSLSAARAIFEQNIQKNAENGFGTSTSPVKVNVKVQRKVMPKSRRVTHLEYEEHGQNPLLSPASSSRCRSMGSLAPSSPRRQPSLEEESLSLTLTDAETDPASLKNSHNETSFNVITQKEEEQQAAQRIQKVSRQWSNKNKVRRQCQIDEFRELQKKREQEASRLEKIKQGRKVENIRTSLDKFEKALEKNKEFGFEANHGPPTTSQIQQQRQQQRRQTGVEAAAVRALNEDHVDDETETEVGEDEHFDEQSLTMEQLQQQHDKTHPKPAKNATNACPQRQPSAESTLSPIRGTGEETTEESSYFSIGADLPVPAVITFGNEDMGNSEITLPSRWTSHAVAPSKESRWNADTRKQPVQEEPERVYYTRPRPTQMKQEEGSRWAIHPRVVYGKPKTEKAVQPQRGKDQRWAATAPGKKKRPQLPQNGSRWAAQPKKKNPVSSNCMPKRQCTKESTGPIFPCNKPRRQQTKENPTPRRGRRRSMIEKSDSLPKSDLKDMDSHVAAALSQPNSMPMLDRSIRSVGKDDPVSSGSRNGKTNKLLSRALSLGEVKSIVSATRIQSVMRMYKERYQYRMKLLQLRKVEVDKETEKELQHIRDCLMMRQQSLRARMERDAKAGVSSTASVSSEASNQDNAEVASLKKQIAELEAANTKLQSQCDRLRASNRRMQSGNKTRDAAVKEVKGRLTKLQLIQTKLDKVYHEFKTEHAIKQAELDNTNAKLKQEHIAQEKTMACLRKIVNFVRPNLEKENPKLMDEVEDTVPIHCLM